MTAGPIAFQSNEGRYQFLGVSSLLNAHAEKLDPDAKGPLAVVPSDGIIQFVDEATTPCRGLIYLEDVDKAYSVHANSVYKVTYSAGTATATRIGTIPGTDPVQLSRNQNASPQVTVRSDAGVQVIASNTDGVAFVTDTDLPDDAVTAEYVSGYTAVGFENRQWFISSLNESLTYDALDFATFQQKAGKLVKIVEDNGELIGFCSKWLEVWKDTGNPDFPFEPLSFTSRGLMAADAVVRCDRTLMFPGDDGIFYRLDNYNPVRVSTHAIERLIQNDASQSALRAFSWSRGGHAFACLAGTDWTRSYDAATQVWHTRQSYGQDTWRARYSMQAWGKTIVGDGLSGKLGYLDSNTYTEYGGTMIWGVDSPPMHVFPNGGIVDAIHFDLATGYGLLSGQGSDPKVMLQTSTDGGASFGGYRELELGVTGKYRTRVTARRLGRFGPKGIVFRLRISDPVVRALVNTDIEVRPLKR
jgi:hypothetical protein